MQRLLIPDCSFIWLFLGDYKALVFSHQRITSCFPADIELQNLLFLAHHSVYSNCAWFRMEHTMHDYELPCSYVGFFQVFPFPANYRRRVSDDWVSEIADSCCLVLAREHAVHNPPQSVFVLKGGVSVCLFVIVAECLQDSNAFVAHAYVIYPTLW